MKRIPLARPDFDEREVEAVRRVLESGWVVQGPEVEAFEQAIARLHEARHCIAVSSGTAALHICYLALRVGPGDAVFLPSFAWPSAANMAMAVGARPVFVDVLPRTYNIDPADLRLRIEQCIERRWAKPRAVVPVHQFGLAVDMDSVLEIAAEHQLDVIEDAACALGATYHGRPVGTFGKLGIFSFHPRKAITTGEGGAIVTNDDQLALACRRWRNHGQEITNGQRDFVLPGMNYRMTEIQAAIGRVQLRKFPEILKHRRQLATVYLDQLADCSAFCLPEASEGNTWQTFMVVLADGLDRGAVIARLAAEGIEVGPGSVAGHYGSWCGERLGSKQCDLPIAAFLHTHGLALPLHCQIDSATRNRLIGLLEALMTS